MADMKKEAQAFMNTHKLSECYECDGFIFKHKENANARAAEKKTDVVTHTANAGAKKKDEEPK